MKRNTARGALIAFGSLLLLATIALPPTLGAGAQVAYREALHAILDQLPPGWVLVERYDRGWFSSHATAELTRQPTTGPNAAAGPAHIRLDSRIDQGPWSWFSIDRFPVAARVHTRVDWLDGPVALPPLFIDTAIGANGSGLAHLLIPAVDQSPTPDGYRLYSKEIAGYVAFRPNPSQVSLDMTIPDVTLATPVGPPARLTDARLKVELTDWMGNLFTGHVSLALASARFGPPSRTGAAGSESILERLTLTLDQAPTVQTQTPRLNLRLKAAADLLQLDGIAYRSPAVGLAARSLDAQTLVDLIVALRTLSSDTTAGRGLAGVVLLVQLLPRFIATGPSLELDPFTMTTPDGPVAARLSLAVGGHNGAAANDTALSVLLGGGPGSWLGALSGDGELALPQPIALAWLGRAALPAGTAPADRLQAWIDGGWVSARDGRVSSTVRLAFGKFSLNGKKVPLRWSALGG